MNVKIVGIESKYVKVECILNYKQQWQQLKKQFYYTTLSERIENIISLFL